VANVEVYKWIAADAAAICAIQTMAGAGALKLNGTLANYTNNVYAPITLSRIARVITVTSTNDLSGVNVTITGLRNQAIVTSTIAGPNNTTVNTSTTLFETVTSVTVNGAAAAIEVGTGQTGQTGWFLADTQLSVANFALQAVVTGTISYSWQVTLDAPNNAGTNPPATVFAPTIFTPITALTSATTNQLANYTAPFKYCNLVINSSTTNATVIFTVLQQGLLS